MTPTRDVDVVVSVDKAAEVIGHLERVDMRRSTEPHEASFTWVRGDLKVQLVRSFHPFPKPPALGLPENPVFAVASRPQHQVQVAFVDDPTEVRLVCVQAACLLALKHAAFGRTRAPDNSPVERDFHDAFLLMDVVAEDVLEGLAVADHEVRARVVDAIDGLQRGEAATAAAGRQMVRIGEAENQRDAEESVRRAARRMRNLIDAGS